MNRHRESSLAGGQLALSTSLVCAFALGGLAQAQNRTYTTNADFDEGVLINVHHDGPIDQLQLGTQGTPFPFVAVACGGLNTVVRIDAVTGQVLGEYQTAPNAIGEPGIGTPMDADPSRATVDLHGNVWVSNRAETGAGGSSFGSVTKIGLVVGGTRVDALGNPDPNGEYLKGPFEYSTAVDRDGDGLIHTSQGLGNVLSWRSDGTDPAGGGAGPALVEDADDEAILVFQLTNPTRTRHLSIDGNNDLWVGGYPGAPTSFDRLSGSDGAFLENLDVDPPGCGGYAGLVDSQGVLWSSSEFEAQVMRYDPAGGGVVCLPAQLNVRGVAIDATGRVWAAGGSEIRRFDAAGVPDAGGPITPLGASQLHGLAVHPADGSVWVTSSATNEVFRLDSTGALITTIAVGVKPRGVAVDSAGKVWVANMDSDDMMRIDPATNAVDLTVALGVGAKPYNPSDMTGAVAFDTTLQTGFWQVVADGGQAGTNWTNASWIGSVVDDGLLEVFVRAAESEEDLANEAWVLASNAGGIAENGRYLEIRTDFVKSSTDISPILFELSIEGSNDPGGGDDCVEFDRRHPGSLLIYPEFNNQSGSATVLTLTNVAGGASDAVTVEFVYIDGDDCSEFNRTEVLTPDDTLSLITRAHNPNFERGYVYVFAKDRLTGAKIVSNTLIGNVMVIDGVGAGGGGKESRNRGDETIDYGINAIAFRGIGSGGLTDLDGDDLLDLDGLEYEMAPDTLLVPRFLGQGGGFHSQLILLALTGGSQFDTTLDFLIYNDNEETFSSEHTFHCWEKISLLQVSGVFANDFLTNSTAHDPGEIQGMAGRESGWMRIDGAVANSSLTSIIDPAFYAVLVERVNFWGAADLPYEDCSQVGGVLLPHNLLGDE